jgi:hypothetical protein
MNMKRVADGERNNILPSLFGIKHGMLLEQYFYALLQEYVKEYKGGYFEIYVIEMEMAAHDASTDEKIVAPLFLFDEKSGDKEVTLTAPGCGENIKTTFRAAIAGAWMMAVNHLSWQAAGNGNSDVAQRLINAGEVLRLWMYGQGGIPEDMPTLNDEEKNAVFRFLD